LHIALPTRLTELHELRCANPVHYAVEAASTVPEPTEKQTTPRNPQDDAPAAPPVFNIPLPVVVLLGLLLVIHGVVEYFGNDVKIWSLYALSFIPQRLAGGEIAAPAGSQIWTFLTYALLHGDWFHLFSNCLWLVIFATPVMRRMGAWRSLLLLAVAAVAGAAAMLPLHWGQFLIVVGASAAVSGAMAAAMPIMYAPGFSRQLIDTRQLAVLPLVRLLRDRNAIAFTAVFFLLQLFTGVSQATTGTAFLGEGVIAWEAHLGGFVAGLVGFYVLDRKRPSHATQV
jgi:membrane associated rhomboid family serine protease